MILSAFRACLCLGISSLGLIAKHVTVTWIDSSSNELGFRVERAYDGATFLPVGTVGSNVTQFIDAVNDAASYKYRVAAYDATTVSPFSNAASVTTIPDAAVPAPSNPPAQIQIPVSVSSSRLVNLAVRTIPGSDDRALIVGFVIEGATKSMLLRAVGPGLSTYTDAPVFQDPKLTIYNGASTVMTNDNWGGGDSLKGTFSRVGAFPLPDTSKDAAVVATLSPKPYSVGISGTGSGLAMAEVYDADVSAQSAGKLVNLSARAFAGPGDGVLIVGFVIAGGNPLRVLVRAIGPTLLNYGVKTAMLDPQIAIYKGSTQVYRNDNWSGNSELSAAFAQTGAFNLPDAGSKDAALLVSLPPGAYTAIASGIGSTEGVVLAEVYEVR